MDPSTLLLDNKTEYHDSQSVAVLQTVLFLMVNNSLYIF
jgi:hypothetical protein